MCAGEVLTAVGWGIVAWVAILLLIVAIVIFLFLGRVRETIIPGIVLPVSLVGTMALMLHSGFNLDTLSLMGIVLAVGFLVDDAIVVLENTVRHLEEGKRPIPAVLTRILKARCQYSTSITVVEEGIRKRREEIRAMK